MINYLWGLMIIGGIIFSFFNGSTPVLGTAVIDSSKEAVSLCITMLGVMIMWTGLINVARSAGIIGGLTRLMFPLLKRLFPNIPEGHPALDYISSNIIANVLGLGWAATPVGLKAMQELSELNGKKKIASRDMCTFLIINISSLQLIPVNIIAYRSQYGSANPVSTIGAGLFATIVSVLVGIVFSSVAGRLSERRK